MSTSMLIENANMQIEAECADLQDRQMLSLFAGVIAPSGARQQDDTAAERTAKKAKLAPKIQA